MVFFCVETKYKNKPLQYKELNKEYNTNSIMRLQNQCIRIHLQMWHKYGINKIHLKPLTTIGI